MDARVKPAHDESEFVRIDIIRHTWAKLMPTSRNFCTIV
jgi:hypothetical protein